MSTLTEAPVVRLMSRYERHRVRLEPPEEIVDARHGKYRVPGTGKMLRFENHRASAPADWLDDIKASNAWRLGHIGLEDDFRAIPPQGMGPRIVEGAMSAATQPLNTAPRQGWDEAGVRQIGEWIAAGVIDLEQAWRYEMAHRRRKMVVRAITEAMLGDSAPEPEEPPPAAAPVSAPIPEGQGGDL